MIDSNNKGKFESSFDKLISIEEKNRKKNGPMDFSSYTLAR